MAADIIDSLLKEEYVNQIPGFFLVMDLNSKFQLANNTAAKWTGYTSADALIGTTYCDLRCKAAEDHGLFIQQDKVILERNQIRFIGYYSYHKDDWKIIMGGKFLIRDKQNKPIGIVSYFDDFTHSNLLDVSRFIINNIKNTKEGSKQFCYLIEDVYPCTSLSNRQSECLFFLLRGKTVKEIAKILNLSPRTVEDYIKQIKFKMHCNDKSELIEKSILNGYMNIIPKSLFVE